jgi:pyrroloquinoline quinone biosynthesis protein E
LDEHEISSYNELTLEKAKELVKILIDKKGFPESEAVLFQKLLWAFVELGEASDSFKKGEKWEIVIEELIDTIFYILDFINLVEKTQGVKFDLNQQFYTKWKKNMERPLHYGLRRDINYSEGLEKRQLKKLTIELTNKCYNECKHCSAFKEGKDLDRFMEYDQIINILDDLQFLEGEEIDLSGGEPLLHPRFYDIATYAKKKGFIVNVFTCGILSKKFDKKILKMHADKIKKIGFNEVQITLHAPNATMHDEITRSPGTFDKTIAFIKMLKNNGENIGVHFVPMAINAEELEELVDYLIFLKLTRLNILRFFPQGRGKINEADLALQPEATAHMIKNVIELCKKPEIKIILGHPGDFRFIVDESHEPKKCSAGKSQCMIQIDGEVIPCPAFGELPDWVAGNVFKKSLIEIWRNSEVFLKLREFEFQRLKGECQTCQFLEKCQGRCPAERIRKNHDIYQGPDPDCPKPVLI